jgi:hypothetical protein
MSIGAISLEKKGYRSKIAQSIMRGITVGVANEENLQTLRRAANSHCRPNDDNGCYRRSSRARLSASLLNRALMRSCLRCSSNMVGTVTGNVTTNNKPNPRRPNATWKNIAQRCRLVQAMMSLGLVLGRAGAVK